MKRSIKVGLAIIAVSSIIVCYHLLKTPKVSPEQPDIVPFQKANLEEHYIADTIYYGGWIKGRPYGCGVMLCPDSTVYSGRWKKGKMHGIIRAKYNNDSVVYSHWEMGQCLGRVDTVEHEGCYGVDMSKYQYGYWSSMLIKKDTSYIPANFVILKASEGVGSDPQFPFHSKMADLTGVRQGVYHIWGWHSDPKKQVDTFLAAIQNVKVDGPYVLDIEGSTLGVSKEKFEKTKPKFDLWLKAVEKKLKKKLMIYCCYDFYSHYGKDKVFAGHEFWIASYTNKKPSDKWPIHQFSEKGKIVDWPDDCYVDLDYQPK